MTRHARAIWTWLALAGLLGSFLPIATMEVGGTVRIYLALAHIAVAAVLIPGLRGTVPAGRVEREGNRA